MRRPAKHWVMYLPEGVRANGGFAILGFICMLSGLSILLGLSEPTTITSELPNNWFNAWGGTLSTIGALLIYSCVTKNVLLERLALRSLIVVLIVFGCWAVAAVGTKALVTCTLSGVIIGFAAVRSAVITLYVRASTRRIVYVNGRDSDTIRRSRDSSRDNSLATQSKEADE